MCRKRSSRSPCTSVQSDRSMKFYLTLAESLALRPACAYAPADLELHCPHKAFYLTQTGIGSYGHYAKQEATWSVTLLFEKKVIFLVIKNISKLGASNINVALRFVPLAHAERAPALTRLWPFINTSHSDKRCWWPPTIEIHLMMAFVVHGCKLQIRFKSKLCVNLRSIFLP